MLTHQVLDARPRRSRVRQVVTAVLGLAAVAAVASSALLLLCAVQVTTPDRPGRVLQLALAQPTLREALAEEIGEHLVAEWAERRPGRPAPDAAPVVREVERALDDPALRTAVAQVRVSGGGTVDYSPVAEAIADALDDAADRLPSGAALTGHDLRRLADDLRARPTLAEGGDDLRGAVASLRGVLLVTGFVVAVGAAVLLGLTLAAAQHARTAAALVVAGAAALLGLLLDPPGSAARAEGWIGHTAASGAAVGETVGRWPSVAALVLLAAALGSAVADVARRLRGAGADLPFTPGPGGPHGDHPALG